MIRIIFFLLTCNCLCFGHCDEDIEIDLLPYRPNNRTVYKQYASLSEIKTEIHINHISDDIGFFIIQVHSFIENLTLSYNSSILLHSHVTGTNIGLIYNEGNSKANFYIFRGVQYNKEVPILLVVTVYDYLDPLPGGCNLSLDNKLAPYQIISYTDDYIGVESQPPSTFGLSCDEDKIEVDMYHMFLREYDNNIQSYFDGIEKMLTVETIQLNGKKVRPAEGYYKYHRLYSAYRGTGEVFAVIATYNNRSSAYVSAVSYGCDLMDWDKCIAPVTDYWKYISALMVLLGTVISFVGHKFFRLTLFIMGFVFGIFFTYLAVSYDGHIELNEKIVTSVIIGFFYGVIWIFIWWKYGVPLLSVHLTFILAGILFASTIFYAGLADLVVFTNNVNFWLTFTSLVIVCLIILVPSTMHGHIFACSFLGAFACVVVLNYYLGGNLQYIIINTLRRATVKDFNVAIVDPPFQLADGMYSALWIFLVVVGCVLQLRDQRGKPPFPPNRSGIILANLTNSPSERSPLLQSESVSVPYNV